MGARAAAFLGAGRLGIGIKGGGGVVFPCPVCIPPLIPPWRSAELGPGLGRGACILPRLVL